MRHAPFCWVFFFFFFRFFNINISLTPPTAPSETSSDSFLSFDKEQMMQPWAVLSTGDEVLGQNKHQSPLRQPGPDPGTSHVPSRVIPWIFEINNNNYPSINFSLHQAQRKVGNPSKLYPSEDISKHPQENSEFWSKKFWSKEKIKKKPTKPYSSALREVRISHQQILVDF